MVHADELLAVALFVAVIGFVYVAAAVVLLRRLVKRPRPPLRWKGRTVLALAALGVVCMLYGRFVEPMWPETTTTRVATARLPAGHRGVRIVHLSDIHSDPAPRLETELPSIVAGLRPDLIVYTGDSANVREGVPVFRACLSEIAKIAPTFAVKGNWDVWFFPELDRFAGTGAVELDSTSALVVVDGAPVHVVGAAFPREVRLAAAVGELPPDGPCVALFHCPYPDALGPFASRVDLMCAGHVHGGQVALPFYGALITLSKWGKKYERGVYPLPEGAGSLYVSRGIGVEGGRAPRVRFCARPEIALIELLPSTR